MSENDAQTLCSIFQEIDKYDSLGNEINGGDGNLNTNEWEIFCERVKAVFQNNIANDIISWILPHTNINEINSCNVDSNANTKEKGTETEPAEEKAPHWSKMTDAEMKELYGNYDYDIRTTGEITAEQINYFIEKNCPNSELKGKGQAFIDAENQYGISALAMLGICGVETSYGTIGHAKDGKYNIVNIQREGYDGTGERWKQYNCAEECIMDLANKLKNNFVESPGKGKVAHLTKLYQVGPKYCPAKEIYSQKNWAKKVQDKMNEVTKEVSTYKTQPAKPVVSDDFLKDNVGPQAMEIDNTYYAQPFVPDYRK